MQEVQQQYASLAASWTNLSDEVAQLLKASKPWKELSDRFDQLSCFVEELAGLVEEEEEEGLDETEGGDLSDRIVRFKVGSP